MWDTIRSAAEAASPDECCGLLIGEGETIAVAWPARNIAARTAARYEVDPRDHVAAVRHARSLGLSVIGAYHSHPHSEPIPSPTDRAEALDAFLYLIAGRTPGASWRARAYVMSQGNFDERPLVFLA